MRHPSDDLLRRQIELFRRMTPEQKLAVVHALQRTGYALTAAGNALRRPELVAESPDVVSREAILDGSA